MAQKINEAGKIKKEVEIDTIFINRKIDFISLENESNVDIVYKKESKDGRIFCKNTIPSSNFKKIEESIWNLIDKEGESIGD